jgi:mitochondrial fission protein ELM1
MADAILHAFHGNSALLHIIAVLDGRPGHEKQTFGIIDALALRTAVKVTPLRVGNSSLLRKTGLLASLFFPFLAPVNTAIKKSSMVICTGSSTHVTALFIKNKYKIKAFACMTPGPIVRGLFDCCFVPLHDKAAPGENIFSTFGAPNSCSDLGRHEKDRSLILIGGVDTASHSWDSKKIGGMVQSAIDNNPRTFWTIGSSPRTPEPTVEILKNISASMDNVSFFDYKETKRGWVEEQYNLNDTVYVSSDSISMLYEAMSAGCRVTVFPMDWKKSTSKFKFNEDFLIEKGMVLRFETSTAPDARLSHKTLLNEAQRCADHILSTWQLKK